jgi:hypothetical protein
LERQETAAQLQLAQCMQYEGVQQPGLLLCRSGKSHSSCLHRGAVVRERLVIAATLFPCSRTQSTAKGRPTEEPGPGGAAFAPPAELRPRRFVTVATDVRVPCLSLMRRPVATRHCLNHQTFRDSAALAAANSGRGGPP